jgi:hypothetical protein
MIVTRSTNLLMAPRKKEVEAVFLDFPRYMLPVGWGIVLVVHASGTLFLHNHDD